jgi:fructokinase
MFRITSIGEILFDVYPNEKKIGGAPFNFLYHVFKLTGEGIFVSRIGRDEPGEEILRFLKSQNISTRFIQIDDKYPTGAAKPYLDEHKVPSWKIEEPSAYDFIELNDKILSVVENQTDCLYFGTLAQRNEKSKNTIKSLLGKKIKYFCDLNLRQNFYTSEIIQHALLTSDIVKMNVEELKLVNEMLIKQPFEIERTAGDVKNKFNIDLLCITMGEEGSILLSKNIADYYRIKVDNIIDTVGAGDAYAAILCIGYLAGLPFEKINKLASEFAAEIIQINGAIPHDETIYNKYKGRLVNE